MKNVYLNSLFGKVWTKHGDAITQLATYKLAIVLGGSNITFGNISSKQNSVK